MLCKHCICCNISGNRVVVKSGTRVRIPPTAPEKKNCPIGRFFFSIEGGIRKAALSNSPVDCCNRRGFSAEKRIPPTAPLSRSPHAGVRLILLKRDSTSHCAKEKHADGVLFSLAQRNKSLAGFVKYASRVKYGCAM